MLLFIAETATKPFTSIWGCEMSKGLHGESHWRAMFRRGQMEVGGPWERHHLVHLGWDTMGIWQLGEWTYSLVGGGNLACFLYGYPKFHSVVYLILRSVAHMGGSWCPIGGSMALSLATPEGSTSGVPCVIFGHHHSARGFGEVRGPWCVSGSLSTHLINAFSAPPG